MVTLEDLYGLKIAEIDGKVCLHLEKGIGTNYLTMFGMFTAWKEAGQRLVKSWSEASKEH